MKNRPSPQPLMGFPMCATHIVEDSAMGGGRGGEVWRSAFVKRPKSFTEGLREEEGRGRGGRGRRRAENDESFDFTVLRITRLPVTTRNEIFTRGRRRKRGRVRYVFLRDSTFRFPSAQLHARCTHKGSADGCTLTDPRYDTLPVV